MKKAILLMTFSILTFFGAHAQVNPGAIGARLGGSNFGSGAELSYQHGFGEANRVELDLGVSFQDNDLYSNLAFGISGIYHWVWNLSDGFNWYVGPGAQIGYYSFSNNFYGNNGITLAVGGQLGLEYDFSTSFGAPLLLSLDLRPMWGLNSNYSGFGYGAALGIRYIL